MALTLTSLGVGTSTANNASVSLTLSQGVAVGEAVAVAIAADFSLATSVTDSRGNTYTKIDEQDAGNVAAGIWWCDALTTALQSGDTISATLAGSNSSKSLAAYALTGVGPKKLRGNNSVSINSSANPSISVAGCIAGDVAVYDFIVQWTTGSITQSAGWTSVHNAYVNSHPHAHASLVLGADGTITAAPSHTSNTNKACVMAVFYEDTTPDLPPVKPGAGMRHMMTR